MEKKIVWTILIVCNLLLLGGCVPGTNIMVDTPASDGDIAGFFSGCWHGFIAPLTFLISLISDDVNMYEVHNSGGWYDFGFVLGAGILFGGGGNAASR